MKKIESLPSIFLKDRRDQFNQNQFVLKIDRMNLLTVDLFKDRQERFDHVNLYFFFKDWKDRIIEDRKDQNIEDQNIEFPTLTKVREGGREF